MSLIINSKFISFMWWLLAPFSLALLINSFIVYMLDDNPYDNFRVDVKGTEYLKEFPKFLEPNISYAKNTVSVIHKKTDILGKIYLQACYSEKTKKFIVFKESGKTNFLDLNQTYKNAKLIDVGINNATFLKDGKKIKLVMETSKVSKENRSISSVNSQPGGYINVVRNDFKRYTTNIRQALRDIRIQELKNSTGFEGIKINFIRRGSLFDRMRLKEGDVVKSIEGKRLGSIMDLLPYYNRLDNISTLQVGFERDGEMKEIVYEIN